MLTIILNDPLYRRCHTAVKTAVRVVRVLSAGRCAALGRGGGGGVRYTTTERKGLAQSPRRGRAPARVRAPHARTRAVCRARGAQELSVGRMRLFARRKYPFRSSTSPNTTAVGTRGPAESSIGRAFNSTMSQHTSGTTPRIVNLS